MTGRTGTGTTRPVLERPAMIPTRRLDVNIHDMSIGLWQNDPDDETFRRDVFHGLLRHLRRRDWTVAADVETERRHPGLGGSHRVAAKPPFLASVQISGRMVKMQIWAETWPKVNAHGHRFDVEKRKRLGFLDRLRFELEVRHLLAWASSRFTIVLKDCEAGQLGPHRGGLTAIEWIAVRYAESAHVPVRPGWPKGDGYGRAAADGGPVEHGAAVWLRDRRGRWMRGKAYANSNMWWVVLGPFQVENRNACDLHLRPPANLRRKADVVARRIRLEAELERAIRAMDFDRAALLKAILFGDAPVYGIYKHVGSGGYFRAACRGYTNDSLSAGRFTRAEAEREVLRAPDSLSLVMPDGTRIRGRQLAGQGAAAGDPTDG